jgi:hypothetical protein
VVAWLQVAGAALGRARGKKLEQGRVRVCVDADAFIRTTTRDKERAIRTTRQQNGGVHGQRLPDRGESAADDLVGVEAGAQIGHGRVEQLRQIALTLGGPHRQLELRGPGGLHGQGHLIGDGGEDVHVIGGEDAFGCATVEVDHTDLSALEQEWGDHDAAQVVY